MNKRLKKLYANLDIPSGAIMAISTVSVLIFSYAAVFGDKKIPGEVVALYGSILGAFAASKTIVKVWGNEDGEQTKE